MSFCWLSIDQNPRRAWLAEVKPLIFDGLKEGENGVKMLWNLVNDGSKLPDEGGGFPVLSQSLVPHRLGCTGPLHGANGCFSR